jgi:hypothetical protein
MLYIICEKRTWIWGRAGDIYGWRCRVKLVVTCQHFTWIWEGTFSQLYGTFSQLQGTFTDY